MGRTLLAAALCVACSSYEPTEPPLPCGLALSPDEETREVIEGAARRWSAATGCPVTVEAGGLPVVASAVSPIPTEGCETSCACITLDKGGPRLLPVLIEFDFKRPKCAIPEVSALHETGHALAPGRGHAKTGLMSSTAGGAIRIDEAALEFVCGDHDCRAFRPESDP